MHASYIIAVVSALLALVGLGTAYLFTMAARQAAADAGRDTARLDALERGRLSLFPSLEDTSWGVVDGGKLVAQADTVRDVIDEATEVDRG